MTTNYIFCYNTISIEMFPGVLKTGVKALHLMIYRTHSSSKPGAYGSKYTHQGFKSWSYYTIEQ